MFFTQIYIYDNSNKNISVLIYKKCFKKCLRLFNKTFSNCQATYQKELYLLFKKSESEHFSQSEHRDDNTSAFMHLDIKINNGKKLIFKPS